MVRWWRRRTFGLAEFVAGIRLYTKVFKNLKQHFLPLILFFIYTAIYRKVQRKFKLDKLLDVIKKPKSNPRTILLALQGGPDRG